MMKTEGNTDVPYTRTPALAIDSFTDALTTERRLLEGLIVIMRRQREAVSDDDLEAVDDSVYATHRVLVTLSEARRRRRSLNTLIGRREDLGIHELDDALGALMTAALRLARDELQDAARALAREVELNRRLLRSVLDRSGSQTSVPEWVRLMGAPRPDVP
jgi:hypothetical protein